MLSATRNAKIRRGIASRLVFILLIFGLAPAAALLAILLFQGAVIKDAFMTRAKVSAASLNDLIDRNLFERYGDVQAFGLNAAVQDRANWGDPSPGNPLVRAMNGYTTGYGIYKLMLLVDRSGRVIAANSVRADGTPLATAGLYGRDFSSAEWFKRAIEGRFLEGTNGITGTAVIQPAADQTVAGLYGEDGYVIPFSAPVTDPGGRTIAIWVNFADFGLVEEIAAQMYGELKADGMGSAELTILGPKGRIIVDYDPMGQGWTEYRRNFDVIGKLNLAEKGVEPAVAAVRGEAGAMVSGHARKGIDQAAGFAHSKGAYGYPGLGWSALVRIPVEQAFAAWDILILEMMLAMIVAAGAIAAAGLFIGRGLAKPIKAITGVMQRLAHGDHEVDVPGAERQDELGEMAQTVLVFKENAGEVARMREEEEDRKREQDEKLKGELLRIADSLDKEVKAAVADTNQQAESMKESSGEMSSIIGRLSQRTTSVSSDAGSAKESIQTVASAAEELSASINEITRQVGQSSNIVERAAEEAQRTDQTVSGLSEAAQKIGTVVNLIQDIAEQTNLLALNATIEAARAGEAGKGFAVVASEVKSLANQTAKATDEIGAQINAIRTETSDAVNAIRSITETITEVNTIAGTIAEAVEQQGLATREISQSVQHAVGHMTEVSSQVDEVAGETEQVSSHSKSVASNADATSTNIDRLEQRLGEVLRELRESAVGNRRQDPRYSGHWGLLGTSKGDCERCSISNLSVGGALIDCDIGVSSGQSISIQVDGIPGGMDATVVNISPRGTHIRFDGGEAVRQKLQELLSQTNAVAA